MSYEIVLHFPHFEATVRMPAVPREGETVEWADPDMDDTSWKVTQVTHTAYPDQEGWIHVSLDPADDYTKNLSDKHEADRLAELSESHAEK